MGFASYISSVWRRFDGYTRISEDLYIGPFVIWKVLQYIFVLLVRGRPHFWYTFESTAKSYPDKIALTFTRPVPGRTVADGDSQFFVESYTYQDVYDIVLRLSFILVNEYGVTADDTIAVDCTNRPLFIFLWFALWNIGSVPSFLNFNVTGSQLVHCLKVVDAKQLFYEEGSKKPVLETKQMISTEIPELQMNFLDEQSLMDRIIDKSAPKLRCANNTRRPNVHDYDPALLIYTSGTTGLPKSAIMSWRKCFLASALFGHVMRIKKKSTVFTAMPLYHSTAAVLGVLPVFGAGGTVALGNKFSVRTFWTQVKLTRATHVQYVGEVCRYLVNSGPVNDEKTHGAKIAFGNGLRPDIWVKFKERFGLEVIGEFYAATEAPFAVTNFQQGDFAIGACGSYGRLINRILTFHHFLVKMDPEDNQTIYRNDKGFCEQADCEEPGELLMRIMLPKKPETSFQGYLNNKKETESKVVRNVFRKGDAFFRTGDLLKTDRFGSMYFVDRLGDTFRWKSENVSATEVENEVLLCSSIEQCVVVGAKVPEHEGRAGFAVIESKPEADHAETLKELAKHVVATLPNYARPLFVKFGKVNFTDNHKLPRKVYANPELPGEGVFWLNGATGTYEALGDEDWQKILGGVARL
ncbi:unnamed protein product [Kuraishia capsulata CBS 1993]|uniref:Very long-chain fatty acid transport protein n=1 Tax=Kuraishia capsulata CBS 1993 TaxID=1382522 RepID=W6MTJ3_9ASCO|nr:uncharacterized protein KUCA_T00004485001 [Kuraishia capsulata CBS 1993]CDK28502.1 unnamed protein product [Kuraishia capsulata CBS 1993]